MQPLRRLKRTALFVLAVLTSGASAAAASNLTLQDFGYGRMAANNHVTSSRPLLMIVADFTNGTSSINTTLNTNYWDGFAFSNTPGSNTLNGFFGENSLNRFQWSRGGTVKIELDEYFLYKNVKARVSPTNGPTDTIWANHIIQQAMALHDFKPYDTDDSGTMSEWELAMIIVHDDDGIGGATRPSGPVTNENATIVWNGSITAVQWYDSQGTFYHELGHLLGASDFYGIWGQGGMHDNLTAMNSGVEHFDAYNKMRWGWVEPRLVCMNSNGVAALWAPQARRTDAPLILYDEARGTNEYFLLEYRDKESSMDNVYETDLADNGLLLWHVSQNTNGFARSLADAMYPQADRAWFRCYNCQMLIKSDFSHHCPGGTTGEHNLSLAENVVPMNDPAAPGEKGWSRCYKCGSLFFRTQVADSVCQAGGKHDGFDSGNITLTPGAPGVWGMKYYYRCAKCQSLFFGYNLETRAVLASNGVCPVGSAHHAAGAPYTVPALWAIPAVISEAKLSATDLTFCRGENILWKMGERTPYLLWFDRTQTPVRIEVQSASNSDGSLVVHWTNDALPDTWVDFGYRGGNEDGSFEHPFNSFAEGVNAVIPGASLKIKSGTSSETRLVTKPMLIKAYGGPVTIGRH